MKKYIDNKENMMLKNPKNFDSILKDSFLRALAYENALKQGIFADNKKAG